MLHTRNRQSLHRISTTSRILNSLRILYLWHIREKISFNTWTHVNTSTTLGWDLNFEVYINFSSMPLECENARREENDKKRSMQHHVGLTGTSSQRHCDGLRYVELLLILSKGSRSLKFANRTVLAPSDDSPWKNPIISLSKKKERNWRACM